MTTKIYAIREKETGEFISCNGHVAFSSAGNAKRSWNRGLGAFSDSKRYLQNSDVYEIVELTEIVSMFEELCND